MTYTTVQILAERRDQIERLQLQAQANEGQVILLRDFTDRVLLAGLDALAPIIAPNGAFVEEGEKR